MKDALTLALLQCTPLPLNVEGNLRRLGQAADRAAAQGADMLVCPEMFITGYAIGADNVRSLATTADGAYFAAVADIARAHHIAVVFGYPERAPDGSVYNAAAWVSADGALAWDYRKTHLFGELDRSQFSAGAIAAAELPLFEGWRIGLLICYDVEFPENTRRLAQAGADLIVVPTANMIDFDFVATQMVPVRAYENQCFVAYANYVGAEASWTYGGLSIVAGPDGATIGQLQRTPALLIARLEREHLAAARKALTHVKDQARL